MPSLKKYPSTCLKGQWKATKKISVRTLRIPVNIRTAYPARASQKRSWVTSVVTLQVYSVVPTHFSLLGADADEWHCWSLGNFSQYFVVQ